MLNVKKKPTLKDGEPCGHPGCLSHVSHPCEGCGRIGGYKKAMPPETIYLQCYDESGNLLDLVRDDVTWCRDRISESDAVYILATSELAELLESLAYGVGNIATDGRALEAFALAACIRNSLD